MMKLKKRLATAGLVLTLSLTSMLPAMAAETAHSGCVHTVTGSTRKQTTEYVKEPCIHGGSVKDRDEVGYLVEFEVIYCKACGAVKSVRQISRTEMVRACPRM